jgi:hypothetical protein
MLKKELMAKAGICLKIVITSLKSGAKISPKLQFGDRKNERKSRLIHARSKENAPCMSRKMNVEQRING